MKLLNSNEYKLCMLLVKSIPQSIKEQIKKKFMKSNELIKSPKWIDIQSSYESFYEINDLDVGKTLRVKIYFIDENKNLNLKYSEEFKITENNNKVITIN